MSGLEARLRSPFAAPADCSAVLDGTWTGWSAAELARRPVVIAGRGPVALGDLCDLSGEPNGSLRLTGEWTRATRVGAGLTEGTVVVDSDVGGRGRDRHVGRQHRSARQRRRSGGRPLRRRLAEA